MIEEQHMGRGSSKAGNSRSGGASKIGILPKANKVIKVGEGSYGEEIKEGYLRLDYDRQSREYEAYITTKGHIMPNMVTKGKVEDVDRILREKYKIGIERK